MNESRLPGLSYDQQTSAIREMMSGLIDYAGLFPPSKLPLDEAINNYARFRQDQDAWMLSRFIIPDGKLVELAAHSELFKDKPPFRFSVTFTGGETYDKFLVNLADTLSNIYRFEDQHGHQVKVEMLESRLPIFENGSISPEILRMFFEKVSQTVVSVLGHPVQMFIEAPWTVHHDEAFDLTYDVMFDHVATAIKWHNKIVNEHRCGFGFKLRCGGDAPSDVPSAETVASALSHVIRTEIPFKATAGLHHPIRGHHDDFGGIMHGFLNVFGAGMLGKEHGLSKSELIDIISDENPNHFKSAPSGFAWKELYVETNDLASLRDGQYISYGSCSFDEPREDLVALGLLK